MSAVPVRRVTFGVVPRVSAEGIAAGGAKNRELPEISGKLSSELSADSSRSRHSEDDPPGDESGLSLGIVLVFSIFARILHFDPQLT